MKGKDETSVLQIPTLPKVDSRDDRSACFIVLTGSLAGRMYTLDSEELVIGRGSEAVIRIEDDGVSRRHAQIQRLSDGSVVLRDLGSTNGTYCNGDKMDERVLSDGDKIQVGNATILKFSYQDSIEQDFQRRQYESATRDALTGCFNKKYFLERLPSELAFANRHGTSVALCMFDIDHFKKINDSYGHPAGDYVLRSVADLVHAQIRVDDVLCRYGGEEFALIMRDTTSEAAFIVAERIRRKIESTGVVFEGRRIPVTISLGIAISSSPRDGGPSSAEELIRIADSYLYKAKHGGRNRTECQILEA